MPILPPNPEQPYDTVATVMSFARVIANDAEMSIAGDLLSFDEPSTLPLLNLAYRQLQNKLIAAGVGALIEPIDIPQFPRNLAFDPTVQSWLGYEQSFDGLAYNDAPVLPNEVVEVLTLSQRQTGSLTEYSEVTNYTGGLPCRLPSSYHTGWSWEGDRVYLSGALLDCDFRLRCLTYFKDFKTNVDGSPPNDARLPVPRAAQALAYYLVALFARGRGSDAVAVFEQKADEALKEIWGRTARNKQYTAHRRRPYGGNYYGGW